MILPVVSDLSRDRMGNMIMEILERLTRQTMPISTGTRIVVAIETISQIVGPKTHRPETRDVRLRRMTHANARSTTARWWIRTLDARSNLIGGLWFKISYVYSKCISI